MTPFTVSITKEIIASCKEVGVLDDEDVIGEKCPIAMTIKDIFPEAFVGGLYIYPFASETDLKINLPQSAQDFVCEFDALIENIEKRLLLPEIEFKILIPDEVINLIEIKDIDSAPQFSLSK